MKPEDALNNLRQRPYATRVRILWSLVVIVAIGVIGLWGYSLKATFSGTTPAELVSGITNSKPSTTITKENYIAVERIESTDKNFTVYFNITNNSENILDFSDLGSIQLEAGNNIYPAKQLTDRQGKPFPVKILSHTENFGILVFDPISDGNGKLTFDNLNFDNSNTSAFRQELNLNFKQLETNESLRQ